MLLLSYLVILVKPILPHVSDFLAHAFWKYEHIATVHQENGTSHVHYELEKAAEKDQSDNPIPILKADAFDTPHVMLQQAYDFSLQAVVLNHHSIFSVFYPGISLKGHYQPPRA